MGTIFVDNLEPQSGTSLTLGASGDSIKASTGAVWTGTVAESSSSSIVENGSNSNGKFTKFADGTMICLMDETLTTPAVTTDIGNGGQVRSNNYTQSLPANFTDTSYQVSFSVGRLFMAGLSSKFILWGFIILYFMYKQSLFTKHKTMFYVSIFFFLFTEPLLYTPFFILILLSGTVSSKKQLRC